MISTKLLHGIRHEVHKPNIAYSYNMRYLAHIAVTYRAYVSLVPMQALSKRRRKSLVHIASTCASSSRKS